MPEGDSRCQDSPEEEACGTGTGDGTSPVRTAGTRVATSSFRGVCWHRKSKRWQAAINSSGRHVYLGSFDSEEEAARMFDKVAIRVRGTKAKLNFSYEEYLGPDGRLVTDPKLEQLVSEARKALLEKQRWLEANDEARGGGKRRRLGAAGVEADCQQPNGIRHQALGEHLAAQRATLHARPPPSHPAFGLPQDMGLSSGVYSAADGVSIAAVGFDAFGPTGKVFPDGLSEGNVAGAREPASATLRRLLLLQSTRPGLLQQGQRGTSGVPSSALQGVKICGPLPEDGAGSALGGATLRRLYDGQIADTTTYGAHSLNLGGVVGVGGRGGSSSDMAGGEACFSGQNGAGQKGGATEQGYPLHLLLKQQQQPGQMAPPMGPGPSRALLLEAAAAAAAVVGAGRVATAQDPQVSATAGAAGLGPRPPYSALPNASGGGGGSAADGEVPAGFCLDLRKGTVTSTAGGGGAQRWNAPADSAAGSAALCHQLDRGGAAAAAAAAAAGAAAVAVDCSVKPSRQLTTGDVNQGPPSRAPAIGGGGGGGAAAANVTSGIDLASLIGRFLSGVRRHLPAGMEIDSLIPCADGSLLGYTLVRVAEGPGAAGATEAGPVTAPQQAGCSSSSSRGRMGGAGGSGRGGSGADDRPGGAANNKDHRMYEAAAADDDDAERVQQIIPNDRGSGFLVNGDLVAHDGGANAGAGAVAAAGARASAAGTCVGAAGAGAGIFFRGTYRDLGFYSSVSDALQACKASMTVVLELKESLMGEVVAGAAAVLGRTNDACAAPASPPPPLPRPDGTRSAGMDTGPAGGGDGGPSQLAVLLARLLQQPTPSLAPSLQRPPPPRPPPLELQPPLLRQEVTDGVWRVLPGVSGQLQLLIKQLQQRQDSGLHHHGPHPHPHPHPHRRHHYQDHRQLPQQQEMLTAADAVRGLVDPGPSAGAYGPCDPGSTGSHRSGGSHAGADGSLQGRPQPQCAPLLSERAAARLERAGRAPEQPQMENKQQQQQQERSREAAGFQAADEGTELRATPPDLLPLAQLVASLACQETPSSGWDPLLHNLQLQQQALPLQQHLRLGSGCEQQLQLPQANPQHRQEATPGKHAELSFLSPPAASVQPSLELGCVRLVQLHAMLELQRFTRGEGGGGASAGGKDAASNGILQALLARCGAAAAGGKQDGAAAAAAVAAAAAAASVVEVSATAEAEGPGAGQLARNPSDSCDSTNGSPSPALGRWQRRPPSPSAEALGPLQGLPAGYSNASSSAVHVREAPALGLGLQRRSGDGGSGANTEADGSGGDIVWQQRDDARPGWGWRGAGSASLSAAAAVAAAAMAAAMAAVPPHIEAGAGGTLERGLYSGGYGQEQVSSGTWRRRRQGYNSQCDNQLYDRHTADVCGSYDLG